MAFLRLFALALVALTVVYFGLFFYLREARRDQLERDYSPSASDKQRDAFINAGVEAYAARMRKVLALIIYGVPLLVFTIVILTATG